MQYTKLSGLTLAVLCAFPVSAAEKPNLVLQITVDGLRADLIERYKHNFGEGGFRYLMEDGTYYTNANYQHGNTETIVGHVSLATGAPPSVHGMVGNVWYDRSEERLVYNVEDGNYKMLTSGAGVDTHHIVAGWDNGDRVFGRIDMSKGFRELNDTRQALT